MFPLPPALVSQESAPHWASRQVGARPGAVFHRPCAISLLLPADCLRGDPVPRPIPASQKERLAPTLELLGRRQRQVRAQARRSLSWRTRVARRVAGDQGCSTVSARGNFPGPPGFSSGDLVQPASSRDGSVDQREAPHFLDNSCQTRGDGCARAAPKEKQTPEEHASRDPLLAPQAPRRSPLLWDQTAGALSRLPSREQPPNCNAAAPARP